ncbi:unnamed protein product [Sphagnum balticum]
MEAFYSHNSHFDGKSKVTLFEGIVVISQAQDSQFSYVGYLPLDSDLRFQRICSQEEAKTKTVDVLGFRLVNKTGQALSFHIQFAGLTSLWVLRLSKMLNEVGFHNVYKQVGKLGKGSSATVYEVERLIDGRVFAAKAFLKSYLRVKEERRSSL